MGVQPHTPQRLTDDELGVFEFFGFSAMPQLHPADLDEIAFHLYALHELIGESSSFWQTQALCRRP
jgi:hypothetical protein